MKHTCRKEGVTGANQPGHARHQLKCPPLVMTCYCSDHTSYQCLLITLSSRQHVESLASFGVGPQHHKEQMGSPASLGGPTLTSIVLPMYALAQSSRSCSHKVVVLGHLPSNAGGTEAEADGVMLIV